MEKFICILVLSLLSTAPTHAQNPSPKPLQWGLEAELVQPFIPTVGILHLLATRQVTSTGLAGIPPSSANGAGAGASRAPRHPATAPRRRHRA